MFINKSLIKMLIYGLCMSFLTSALWAHDEGHESPGTLPPVGPHGGNYAKMERHFAEVRVSGNRVTVYILEPDVKYVAEDAIDVGLVMELPGQPRRNLSLQKVGEGYVANVDIPRTARRVLFHVSCSLDGNPESGTVQYEPRN
ncbi:MAG: hypothetical protein KDK34_05695 [Leptospiraceae bacterium]|nr:hypothetical protein [Leptospiraceae bacterium]